MNPLHKVILSIGSNIAPEKNLKLAISALRLKGQILAVSSAWESKAIGGSAPNYLNACLIFLTPLSIEQVRENIIRHIEAKLGRERRGDKFAPRPIDIDIVMFDEEMFKLEYWNRAFLLVPLAQIAPNLINPLANETVQQSARKIKELSWIIELPEVLNNG